MSKETPIELNIRTIAEDVYNAHRDDLFLQLTTAIEEKSNRVTEEEIKEIIEHLMPDLNKIISNVVKTHLEFVVGKLLKILKLETET